MILDSSLHVKQLALRLILTLILSDFKVVPGGSHGYFFEVKVATVKLIGGR